MKPPNCFRCDYDLTGLPEAGACPECGDRYGDVIEVKAAMRGARGNGWPVLSLQLVAIALGLILFIFATRFIRQWLGMTDWYLTAMMASVAVYFAWILGSFFLLPRLAKRLNIRDASFDQRLRFQDNGLATADIAGGDNQYTIAWNRLSDPRITPHRRNPREYEFGFRMLLSRKLPFRMRLVYIIEASDTMVHAIRTFVDTQIERATSATPTSPEHTEHDALPRD